MSKCKPLTNEERERLRVAANDVLAVDVLATPEARIKANAATTMNHLCNLSLRYEATLQAKDEQIAMLRTHIERLTRELHPFMFIEDNGEDEAAIKEATDDK